MLNSQPKSIEDIILSYDKRGISALRPYLPPDYCRDAARFILEKGQLVQKTAIIVTGFYILNAQAPETDGPSGAIALARALKLLDFEVIMVTDSVSAPLLKTFGRGAFSTLEFPIAGPKESQEFAQKLLAQIKPAIILSIERCGVAGCGKYLNMRGKDISEHTAMLDYLFLGQDNTIGIGDGGNEIGMGNLAEQVKKVPSLVPDPATTGVYKLVIASVSNWGGYGLIAALSQLTRRDLLPSVDWDSALLKELAWRGAVDGVSGKCEPAVDGFTCVEHGRVLAELRALLYA